MRKFAIHLVAVIILGFSAAARSQGIAKPILVDEFGLLSCEDFASRTDAWIQERKRYPQLHGFALVSGPANDILGRIRYREWIKGQLLWRFKDAADRDKFTILERGVSDGLKVELFLAAKNDSSMYALENRWDLSLSIKKKTPYYQSQGDGGICPYIDHAQVFKELLAANRSLDGRVIIYESIPQKFENVRRDFLSATPQIVESRLSFVRPRHYNTSYDGAFEYWFVPARR